MDWLHCNKCYLMPKMNQSRFLITNCSHVFCEACLVKNPEQIICHVCSAQCRLRENVLVYFRDPLESFKQSLKVMEFQKAQTARLLKYFRHVMANVPRMTKECRKLSSELDKYKTELDYFRQRERAFQEMSSRQEKQLAEMSTQLANARRPKSPTHCSPYFFSQTDQRKMQEKFSPFKTPVQFPDPCANANFPTLRAPASGQTTPRSGRLVTSTAGCAHTSFANLFRSK